MSSRRWAFSERENADEVWKRVTLIDPDFDDFGGLLSLAQIRDPVPIYGERRLSEEEKEQRRRYRREQYARTKVATDLVHASSGSVRFSDPECRRCVPYNGSHTPNYWNTGQKDIW